MKKEKILGRISIEVHERITTLAKKSNLTVDDFLWIVIRNWEIAKEPNE